MRGADAGRRIYQWPRIVLRVQQCFTYRDPPLPLLLADISNNYLHQKRRCHAATNIPDQSLVIYSRPALCLDRTRRAESENEMRDSAGL